MSEEIFDDFGASIEVVDENEEVIEARQDQGQMVDVVDDTVDLDGSDLENIDLQRELRETKERFVRLNADFINFRKRQEREREEHTKYANERLLRDLLPVIDNLERAIESAKKAGEAAAITSGLELVVQEFLRAIKRSGAEPIEAVGKPFDPAIHEALQRVETDAVEPGYVAFEILRGYMLNGRVLRVSLVAVATGPEITSPDIENFDQN